MSDLGQFDLDNAGGPSTLGLDEEEEEDEFGEIRTLQQAWVDEKLCPEILTYESELVDNLREQIENQQRAITENSDASVENKDIANYFQMEVDRIRFLVKSYLRTRLLKIEKYALYALKTATVRERLSQPELEYAKSYVNLLESHFKESFLSALPQNFRNLDSKEGNLSMIPTPNFNTHVFFRVTEPVGDFEIAPGDSVSFSQGDIYIMRYERLQTLLAEKKIQLI